VEQHPRLQRGQFVGIDDSRHVAFFGRAERGKRATDSALRLRFTDP
jgi:hypothetical protein